MRALGLGALLAAMATAFGGCGAGSSDSDASRYLDAQSAVVASLSLDYGGEDWAGLKVLYAKAARSGAVRQLLGIPAPPTLDGGLALLTQFSGLSFEKDIKPLLGGRLLAGLAVTPPDPLPASTRALLEHLDEDQTTYTDEGVVYHDAEGRRLDTRAVERALALRSDQNPAVRATFAYRAPDAGALGRVIEALEKLGVRPRPLPGVKDARSLVDGIAVVGGDTLVAAFNEDGTDHDPDDGLRAVLRRAQKSGGARAVLPGAGDALIALRATPAALGLLLDSQRLARLRSSSRLGKALASLTARLDVSETRGVTASARMRLRGIAPGDLPIGPAAALLLPVGEPLASASADQQHTTVALAGLARELLPDSLFVRRVEALESKLGLRFEDEVLKAFSGPSVSVLRASSRSPQQFAAASSLADASSMRALLPRIAPSLPRVLQGLQGLGSTGLAALLFVAPDAPLTPEAASFGSITVFPITADAGSLLYGVRGLDPLGRLSGPDRLVFGVVGDRFVVGSTKRLALEASKLVLKPAGRAGTMLRADLGRLTGDAETRRLIEAVLGPLLVQASAQGTDLVASAAIPPAK